MMPLPASPPALHEGAIYNTPQLQLVVLQIFAQLQHDRDIARSQYQMAKFQLSREEDRCRKEQFRRMTMEHQLNEQVAVYQAKSHATLETAAEVGRLLDKARQESEVAMGQASRFKEYSEKKDKQLAKLKNDFKLLENVAQMVIKETKLAQQVSDSQVTQLQLVREQSRMIEKKLLEKMYSANDFQRQAEERQLLLKAADTKIETNDRDLQSARHQIMDLQTALLNATEKAAYWEAKYQMSLEEATRLKRSVEADKELMVQSWVAANATIERLKLTLEQEKNRSRGEDERARVMFAEEKTRHQHKENSLIQEKLKVLKELEAERNKTSSLQDLLQNITSGLNNLTVLVTTNGNNQAICQKEKQKLQQKFDDEKRNYEERNSVTTQNVISILRQLNETANANRQLNEYVKQTLLIDLQSERSSKASLQSSFSSAFPAQLQHLKEELQAHHLNITRNWEKYIIRPKENAKLLPLILNGRTKQDALFAAARNGNITELEILLDNGANIESYDDRYKETPLIWAAEYGKAEACSFLLERGANLNARATGWGNRTPLHAAAVNNRLDVIKLLVAMGADLTAKDSDGKLPSETGNDTTKAWFRNRSR